tara:strand:- start:4120 stop:5583 length:1464 start_codon:yes stop_codon:yes gene_type:complete
VRGLRQSGKDWAGAEMDLALISFLSFFALFTLVGVTASFFKKNNIDDYFLASRDVPSWMVALSYGATISSGATFIGFAGLAYSTGIMAFFVVAGLTVGDHLGWLIAGHKIRRKAEDTGARTYPSLIGKLIDGRDYQVVILLVAIMTVIFMGMFCSAQLVAGAKVGVVLFGWDYNLFILAGAAVLLAYCWAGGIRASIWTDTVQSVMIFVSLAVLVYVALDDIGGLYGLYNSLHAIDPALVNPFQSKFIVLFLSWIAFGVGVLGQPYLMVRHMVAKSDESLVAARRIYLCWRWAVLVLAILVGCIARVLIPIDDGGFDAELSIPALWQNLLPPAFVGFLVAGLFSATMSTADSLLLSASSALTQHIFPQLRDSYKLARIGTVVVICLVVMIAFLAGDNVLSLVVLAWGWMGSAVAPLVIICLFGGQPGQRQAITIMAAGFGMTVFWRYGLNLNAALIDIVPGMVTGFAVYFVHLALEKYVKSNTFDVK